MSLAQRTSSPDGHATTRPVPTLLGARYGDLDNLTEGSLALAGVYCDHHGEGSVGGRFAPRQLRYAQWPALGAAPSAPHLWCDVGDLNVYPLDWRKNVEALERQASALADRGARCLFVNGDYSNTAPLFRGSMQKIERGARGLVRIARGLDLRPIAGPTTCPVRASATWAVMDNMTPGPSTVLLVLSSPAQLKDELHAMRSMDVQAMFPDGERAYYLPQLEQAIQKLQAGCEGVYVSLDADAIFDATTGATWPALEAILSRLTRLPLVAGDFTGFVPAFGMEGRQQTHRAMGVLHSLATTIARSSR